MTENSPKNTDNLPAPPEVAVDLTKINPEKLLKMIKDGDIKWSDIGGKNQLNAETRDEVLNILYMRGYNNNVIAGMLGTDNRTVKASRGRTIAKGLKEMAVTESKEFALDLLVECERVIASLWKIVHMAYRSAGNNNSKSGATLNQKITALLNIYEIRLKTNKQLARLGYVHEVPKEHRFEHFHRTQQELPDPNQLDLEYREQEADAIREGTHAEFLADPDMQETRNIIDRLLAAETLNSKKGTVENPLSAQLVRYDSGRNETD